MREVQCRASRHTHGTGRAWNTHATARIVTACARGQLQERSARASLTFSQELRPLTPASPSPGAALQRKEL